jgi:opacity protein-like surface antigen
MMRVHPARLLAAAALAALLTGPAAAAAQSNAAMAMDDRWHFFVAPYLWGSGLEGTVGVNDVLAVPVDLSFGDVIEDLDFALLGRFEGRKNRLGFGLDVSYMNLGVDVTGPVTGRLGLGADVRSLTVEGISTWRVVDDDAKGGFVDLLSGVRYMKNRAGLTLERDGVEVAGTERTLDWVDALAGARFRLALGPKAGLHGRADVAGFGSDFTWNLQGGLELRLGERWKTGAGYRYLDVDYDKGEGLGRRIWKMTYQGPYAFAGYSW